MQFMIAQGHFQYNLLKSFDLLSFIKSTFTIFVILKCLQIVVTYLRNMVAQHSLQNIGACQQVQVVVNIGTNLKAFENIDDIRNTNRQTCQDRHSRKQIENKTSIETKKFQNNQQRIQTQQSANQKDQAKQDQDFDLIKQQDDQKHKEDENTLMQNNASDQNFINSSQIQEQNQSQKDDINLAIHQLRASTDRFRLRQTKNSQMEQNEKTYQTQLQKQMSKRTISSEKEYGQQIKIHQVQCF